MDIVVTKPAYSHDILWYIVPPCAFTVFRMVSVKNFLPSSAYLASSAIPSGIQYRFVAYTHTHLWDRQVIRSMWVRTLMLRLADFH